MVGWGFLPPRDMALFIEPAAGLEMTASINESLLYFLRVSFRIILFVGWGFLTPRDMALFIEPAAGLEMTAVFRHSKKQL